MSDKRAVKTPATDPASSRNQGSEPAAPGAVLFEDVRIFDGKSEHLSQRSHVLVRGGAIARISADPMPVDNANTEVVAGAGKTLMPGLIDAHWHSMMAAVPMSVALTADPVYLGLVAGAQASNTLMDGFTSVRDMAGPAFGLKRAIDQGVTKGPRIWPSGAMISQSGGHGDYRMPHEVPQPACAHLSHGEVAGAGIIADGADQVLRRAREQLMLGASQIKLAVGGGVASTYDPIDVTEYTEREIHAAVEAADNWGTYVAVHVYTPHAIQQALRAGVRCIEHGQLIDEPTAERVAKADAWLSMQPFLADEDANAYPEGSDARARQAAVAKGTDKAYKLAAKYDIKTAWGTDILFNAKLARRHGAQLAKMARWYTPAQVLQMATRTNAELLSLSGPRNPYPGELGVVAEGAMADLILVDGNPLDDIQLVADAKNNFVVIMKAGTIYKNTLTPG